MWIRTVIIDSFRLNQSMISGIYKNLKSLTGKFDRKVRLTLACRVIIICSERMVNAHNGHFAIRNFYSLVVISHNIIGMEWNGIYLRIYLERDGAEKINWLNYLLSPLSPVHAPSLEINLINNQGKILYANLFRAPLNWKQTEILMFFITLLCDVIKLSNKDLSMNY